MQKARTQNGHSYVEAWLLALIDQLRPVYEQAGLTIPAKYRATVAFTSRGRPPRENRKGPGVWPAETWPAAATNDGYVETIIRADLDHPLMIGCILAHELIHASLPGEGHGPRFRDAALRLGLEGKMAHALPGPPLRERLNQLVQELGPLPRARLNFDQVQLSGLPVPGIRPKQPVRMRKAVCARCGYTVRVAAKWVSEIGPPHCPKHGPMVVDMDSEAPAAAHPDDIEDGEASPVVALDPAPVLLIEAAADVAGVDPSSLKAAE